MTLRLADSVREKGAGQAELPGVGGGQGRQPPSQGPQATFATLPLGERPYGTEEASREKTMGPFALST